MTCPTCNGTGEVGATVSGANPVDPTGKPWPKSVPCPDCEEHQKRYGYQEQCTHTPVVDGETGGATVNNPEKCPKCGNAFYEPEHYRCCDHPNHTGGATVNKMAKQVAEHYGSNEAHINDGTPVTTGAGDNTPTPASPADDVVRVEVKAAYDGKPLTYITVGKYTTLLSGQTQGKELSDAIRRAIGEAREEARRAAIDECIKEMESWDYPSQRAIDLLKGKLDVDS